MPAYSKQFLSASGQAPNGQPIDVTGILPSTANVVHTSLSDSGSGQVDEIWAWAYVQQDITADRELRVVWGASTATGHSNIFQMTHVIPGGLGPQLIVPGWPLNNGMICLAYATVASDVSIIGYVNRAT